MSVFTLEATDGGARAGVLHTAHGDVPTPAFMPVATQASVKALDAADVRAVGASILLANAFHLYLRPGVGIVQRLGGLHGFMGWNGPVLTDSGGFQAFSLEGLSRVTDDAIVFKSPIDGSTHTLTPEAAVAHQEALGADVIMPLDVCLPVDRPVEELELAVERTGRWAVRCRDAQTRGDQALFGIVQGGLAPDLRKRAAEEVTSLGFPGYAIGGLSVGESRSEMREVAALTTGLLPAESPRYLMGLGSPEDLVECVARGVDMFDCVLPTRIARSGSLMVSTGRANIYTAPFRERDGPIEPGCDCYTCADYTAAYLHHLFRTRELLAYRLATIHNLRFVLRLMDGMRAAVLEGRFQSFREEFLGRFVPTDEAVQKEQKRRWEVAQRRRGRGRRPPERLDRRGKMRR